MTSTEQTSQKDTVLLIEDQDFLNDLWFRMLEPGYNPATAEKAQMVVDSYRESYAQGMRAVCAWVGRVTDMESPDRAKIIHELRSIHPSLPVIILTGNPNTTKEECEKAQLKNLHVEQTPFERSQIPQIIQQAIDCAPESEEETDLGN